jgi:WD40 repeat protein
MGDCCAACHDRREEGAPSVALCTTLQRHTDRVTSLAFLADGQGLAAADESCTWAVWDVRTGGKLHAEATSTRVARLAGVPGVRSLAVRRGGAFDLIDPTTRPPHTRTVAGLGKEMLLDLALSPDGQLVAVLTPNALRVYDHSGREIINVGTAGILEGPLGFSPDSRLLAALMGRQVAVAEINRKRFGEPIGLPGEWARAHAFAPDGRTLALALSGHGPRVALWDLPGRRLIRTWQLLDNDWARGNRLLFHQDGRTLLGTATNRLVAWDVTTGAVLADLAARVPALGDLALSPDGTLVATATTESTIRLWPIELLSTASCTVQDSMEGRA